MLFAARPSRSGTSSPSSVISDPGIASTTIWMLGLSASSEPRSGRMRYATRTGRLTDSSRPDSGRSIATACEASRSEGRSATR